MKSLSILTEKKTMISWVERKGCWISEHETQRILISSSGKWKPTLTCLSRAYHLKTSETYLFSEFLPRHERTILCSPEPAPMLHSVSAYSVVNPLLFTHSLYQWFTENLTFQHHRDLSALCHLRLDLGLECCPLCCSPGASSLVVPKPPQEPEGRVLSRY